MKGLYESVSIQNAISGQTAAGATSGDWVSLKGYDGCLIVVKITQGAANTTAITVDKATAVAGTGNSDGITMKNFWYVEDDPTGDRTKGTAAASITSSNTGSGTSMYFIDIKAEDLGAYDCIQVELGASSASNVVSADYILYDARYSPASIINPTSD